MKAGSQLEVSARETASRARHGWTMSVSWGRRDEPLGWTLTTYPNPGPQSTCKHRALRALAKESLDIRKWRNFF